MTRHQPYAWICRHCEHRVALHTLREGDGLYQCPCGCNIDGDQSEMYGVDKAAFETGKYEPNGGDERG